MLFQRRKESGKSLLSCHTELCTVLERNVSKGFTKHKNRMFFTGTAQYILSTDHFAGLSKQEGKSNLKLCFACLVGILVQPVTVLPAQVIYGGLFIVVGTVLRLACCFDITREEKRPKPQE